MLGTLCLSMRQKFLPLQTFCSDHSPWLWTGAQAFGVALGPLHDLFPLPNNQTLLRLVIGLFRSPWKRLL